MRHRKPVAVLCVVFLSAVVHAALRAEASRVPLLQDCTAFEVLTFPASSASGFHGLVLNGAEQPPVPFPGVQVELLKVNESASQFVLSEEDGTFDFGSVAPGQYVLRTCRGGWDGLEVTIEVNPDEPEKRLELVVGPSEAPGKRDLRWVTR